jgi:uncharacterized protein YjiS (DUF1127 family)
MHGMITQTAIRLATWATGGVEDLFRTLGRRRHERRTAAGLRALDDATLKDLGLYRGEIPSIARAPAIRMLAALAAVAILSATPARAEVAANGLTTNGLSANGSAATGTGLSTDLGAIARATVATGP